MQGIARIETVGAIVRGPHGLLARITAVLENTRASENHISAPLDVVVLVEPIGPGYRDGSAWASQLQLADGTEAYGAHPHGPGCACGEPYTGFQHWQWQHLPASWQ